MSFPQSPFGTLTPSTEKDKKKKIIPFYQEDQFGMDNNDFSRFFSENHYDLFPQANDSSFFNLPRIPNQNNIKIEEDDILRNQRTHFEYSPIKWFQNENFITQSPIQFRKMENNKANYSFSRDSPFTPYKNRTRQEGLSPQRDNSDMSASKILPNFQGNRILFLDENTSLRNKNNKIEDPKSNAQSKLEESKEEDKSYSRKHKENSNVKLEEHEGENIINNPQQLQLRKGRSKTFERKKKEDLPKTQTSLNPLGPNQDLENKKDEDRNSKRNRIIGQKIKEIFAENEKISFQEVAELLLEKSKNLLNFPSGEIQEEGKSLKKRISTAIGVLVASGILQKEGKMISKVKNVQNYVNATDQNKRISKVELETKIERKKKVNKAKLENLQKLAFKTLAIKNLIKNNKENDTSSQVQPKAETKEVTDEPSQTDDTEKNRIKFPFIAVSSLGQENAMNVNLDKEQRILTLDSKYPLQVFGDIDVLVKMNLHHVSSSFLAQVIPEDLQKLLPQEFLNSLSEGQNGFEKNNDL